MTSPWDTEEGLTQKYSGTVTDAYFDEGEYGGTLKLTVESPDLDAGSTENWYGCGKGVVVISDDKVDLANMKGAKFNTQSGVGSLIAALVKDERLISQVSEKGGPDEAQSFVGLAAQWELKEFTFKSNGEDVSYTRMLPVGVIGEGVAEETPDVDVPKWLIIACSEADNYTDFMAAALAHDEVTPALRKVILNESFWDFA